MNIVNAFWEMRNLGVTCTEVAVEEFDTVDAVKEMLLSLTAQYQVIKVPIGRYDLMEKIENSGFSFIEGSMSVVHHLKQAEPSGILQRLNASITYAEMDPPDIERLYSEIRKGIFTTDRIYLDKVFSPALAAQRYVSWLQDEVGRGAQLYKLIYKTLPVGFFVLKETAPGWCYPFLSGLYAAEATPGLGNILLHKIINEAMRRGLKSIASYISTNNLPVVKVHMAEGFNITNIHYVYIRHVKQ